MATSREMTLDDLVVIEKMEQELFGISAWRLEDYRTDLLDNPYSSYYVVEKNGEILGYCGYFALYENAEILTIGVTKAHQGQGYARMMMDIMLEGAKNKKASMMSLEVRVSNVRAQKLYSGYGFEVAGVRPRYYKDGENALLMVKSLEGEQ